jgi:hypothetical protein
MNSTVRRINSWFSKANCADVNDLLSKIILSERQTRIFEMFYLKRQTIGFIADTLGASQPVISRELNLIRDKILTIIQ